MNIISLNIIFCILCLCLQKYILPPGTSLQISSRGVFRTQGLPDSQLGFRNTSLTSPYLENSSIRTSLKIHDATATRRKTNLATRTGNGHAWHRDILWHLAGKGLSNVVWESAHKNLHGGCDQNCEAKAVWQWSPIGINRPYVFHPDWGCFALAASFCCLHWHYQVRCHTWQC